jgi:predicted esterase YcpF (UPF0227 family)
VKAHPASSHRGPAYLYLHGFASSPGSAKAKAFAKWASERGLPLDVLDLRVPSFDRLLLSSMTEAVTRAIDAAGGARARVVLIGSSLGGLTACRVAEADPRVAAVFLMAPAFQIAARWEGRIGAEAWASWKETGFVEVDDHATKQKARVHWGFVEELARMDAELGPWPDVRVPVRLVHGVRDDVVDIDLSREWSKGKRHVRAVEVDDDHELRASIPRILEEADDFLAPFLGRQQLQPR